MKKLFKEVMLISVMIFFSASILIAGETLDKNISKLVGMEYSPNIFPKGYKNKGGFVITDNNNKLTDYLIDVGMQKGSDIILLTKVTQRDASRHIVNRKILDVIKLPAKQKNETISFSCLINGEWKNISVVASVDGKTSKVHRAWRGNIQSGKIEEISIKGITCETGPD